MSLMRNPLAFKKRYILKIYDDNYSPSAIVGQGCHKAAEVYLRALMMKSPVSVDQAVAEGLKLIEGTSDTAIDYGKTGSREKMLKDYTNGVQTYFEEMPDWKHREILFVEERMTETIHDDSGNELPLPAKCFVDVLWRSTRKETFAGRTYPKGALFITDHKFVRGYSDPDDDDPARLVQSMFNFHIVLAKLGERPAAMLYDETKLSKNKDGSPQLQTFAIDYENHPHYFHIFYNLYNDCTKFVMNENAIFLPNFTDTFDGKNSYQNYTQNLIGVEAPVSVPKKKQEVQFVDKQYTPSAVDKVENKNLTLEEKIRLKLLEFGVPVEMLETHTNGSISMYTLKPSRGVRMKSIESYSKDIALALEAPSIRVKAPIMGTSKVGIEVPNKKRSVLNYEPNPAASGTMLIPIGQDVYGENVVKDLREMPHCLIAGSTGSGKSVMLNVILKSLTEQMTPEDMQLVLIDPKRVELSQFKDVPHLMSKVIYDHGRAMRALKWLVDEMEERYMTLEQAGARSIEDYAGGMSYIVCVIDEFADLMLESKAGFTEWTFCPDCLEAASELHITNLDRLMKTKAKRRKKEQQLYEAIFECAERDGKHTCQREDYPPAEELIVRLAQKARAVGIHLVIATQRPTVNVVTGLVKNNMPTRIAFSVPAQVDSKVMIDDKGAESLVGKGDMLFVDPATKEPQRLQGYYA